jgi:hypothetical protein
MLYLHLALLCGHAQVAVVDSGVDGSHPDINYVGGKAFVVPSAAVAGDVADPNVDLYGEWSAAYNGMSMRGKALMAPSSAVAGDVADPNVDLYGEWSGALDT